MVIHFDEDDEEETAAAVTRKKGEERDSEKSKDCINKNLELLCFRVLAIPAEEYRR